MQLYDANLYDLWVSITQGDVENPSEVIATTFTSRYLHTDLNHREFLQIAAKYPGLKEVYRDDQAVIFEVVSRREIVYLALPKSIRTIVIVSGGLSKCRED